MREFVEISNPEDGKFADAMDIYSRAFPQNEKHPIQVIRERVRRGLNKLYVGHIKDEVVFMALLWPLEQDDFILLDYLATKDAHRGKGIASAFLRKMRDEVKAARKYLILEVENPRFGSNTQERKKRVAFYRHLGARELDDVRYLLPPLEGDIPTEMILMILPDYEHKKISGDVVKQTITKIYRELYGRDDRDALLRSFINQIGEIVNVV